MIGGLVGAGLDAAGLVERKSNGKAVQDIGPFGGGMMGIGGLAGMATQGGFMGNAAGMFPLVGGLAGMALNQFGPKEERKSFDMGKALGAAAGYLGMGFGDPAFSRGFNTPVNNYGVQNLPYRPGDSGLSPTPLASMFNGPQMGQAGGLLGNANFFSDPMTIKRVS